MSQQAMHYLRPQVARTLSRALPFASSPQKVSEKQSTGQSAPAAPAQHPFFSSAQHSASFYPGSSAVPQVFVVYGHPAYASGYVGAAPSYSRSQYPSSSFQQPVRSSNTRANPARLHGGPASGLGLVDETFFAPVQSMTYLPAAYAAGGTFVYAPYGPSGIASSYSSTAPGSLFVGNLQIDSTDDTASTSDSAQAEGRLHPGMNVEELYFGIQNHLNKHANLSLTWLNRMFAKCATVVDFAKGLEMFHLCQKYNIETTPETGTLLIKAACRAGVPEKALKLLRNMREVRFWPTLGGIHYLMINFSLKKDTESVLSTFEATRERHLKPNVRTYHILIRECVDNQQIEQALQFAADCKAHSISPNRVMYNILMNGCRKANKPSEILALRAEMDSQSIELNDTTVKFTILAYLMLSDVPRAVAQFVEFTAAEPSAVDSFGDKFVDELSAEPDALDHVGHVRTLFDALRARSDVRLSDRLVSRLAAIEAGSASPPVSPDADTPDEADIPLRRTV
eukprot:TRINITY_DN2917_c0_g1_i1.p1 TRINITY_DN2917_c0_g1~~TRINITY_DN2917_c0_g1_i1.p1  ORF type:complete len:510 (-),score=67.46 TRINITY_DN2917_c0_g1_i1:269-1798(-)